MPLPGRHGGNRGADGIFAAGRRLDRMPLDRRAPWRIAGRGNVARALCCGCGGRSKGTLERMAPDRETHATAKTASRLPRRLAFAACLVLAAGGVLACCARLPWSGPPRPAAQLAFDGDDFDEHLGTAFGLDGRLQISSFGRDGTAMQTRRIDPIEARRFPLLRYRLDDFPDTLELTFVFRRRDHPGDVETVTLPWPGAGTGSFDLGRIPAWRGEITEIGFAEYPTAQLVPGSLARAPFTLEHAALWSPSWQGSLAALTLDWFGYRPWGLFSVSSVSHEAGPDRPRAPALVLASSVLLAVLALAARWLLGWCAARLAQMLILALGLGWLLLDARQLGELYQRLFTTREIYAGKPWPERARLVPDQALKRMADRVRTTLLERDRSAQVLVLGGSPFQTARLYYHLLPLDVGFLEETLGANGSRTVPPGTLLALYDSGWNYDPASGLLHGAGAALAVAPLMEQGPLAVYRVLGDAAP
jgi:hypothetical protein